MARARLNPRGLGAEPPMREVLFLSGPNPKFHVIGRVDRSLLFRQKPYHTPYLRHDPNPASRVSHSYCGLKGHWADAVTTAYTQAHYVFASAPVTAVAV